MTFLRERLCSVSLQLTAILTVKLAHTYPSAQCLYDPGSDARLAFLCIVSAINTYQGQLNPSLGLFGLPSLVQCVHAGCSREHLSFRLRQEMHAGPSSSGFEVPFVVMECVSVAPGVRGAFGG